MSAKPPPIPPDQRNPRDPGATTPERDGGEAPPQDHNLAEQGRQGNIKQNTTNKGLQQDR